MRRYFKGGLELWLQGNINKVAQESDIPSRIIKENSNIVDDFLLSSFHNAIQNLYFPTALKQTRGKILKK